MKTIGVVFPFDQFGSSGTGAGAQVLGDALREILDDVQVEQKPHRGECFAEQVRVEEFTFDTPTDFRNWRENADDAIREALETKQSLLWLSGNHLCSLPIYEQLNKKDLVIQFDAHLDVYNLSDSVSELSHGNFLMHSQKGFPQIVNIGSRDQFLPARHTKQYFSKIITAEQWHLDPTTAIKTVGAMVKKAERIWLDIDCDVFDPAFFPAVQHPLPFGLSPADVLKIISSLWSSKIAGVSISEFDPGRDQEDRSLATMIWFMEWFLLKSYESKG